MNSLADTQPIQSKTILPVIRFSKQQAISYGLSAVSIILSIVLWQFASHYHVNLGFINFANVPSPIDVIHSFVAFVELDTALAHVKASIVRVLIGFFLAGLVGVILGLLIGYSKAVAAIFMPPLEILRPIPAVAWIPLAILMFPSSEASMIFITFLGALFPILLNTIHGVEAVDRRLLASAQSLGAGQFAILREVIIPGSLPSITTGLAIGMGTCWFCLVTAEMISGQLGIGYFTWESFTLQNYADIIVGMLLIGALGMLSSALLRFLGKKLTPWYQLRKA